MMEHLHRQWRTAAGRDIHSPLNMDPADYDYEAFYDLNEVYNLGPQDLGGFSSPEENELRKEFERMQERIERQGYHGRWHERGGCDHCGANNLRFINVYTHAPTKDLIIVGVTCSERLGFENRNEFNLAAARMREMSRKKAAEIRAKQQTWRAANPDAVGIMDIVLDRSKSMAQSSFMNDMARAYKNYGGLTERQTAAMVKSFEQDQARDLLRAAEAEHPLHTIKMPVPTANPFTIEGVVISTKVVESDYGSTLKALIEDHRGFRVWGTVPSAADWDKGDRVRFVCSTEPSNDDPYFGFFKRPRKVEDLNHLAVRR